ncbi:unnamed protein product [Rotaria magnacalcarata]|nr:unnamed protein product [Rotaria magnacalcarata]CAF1265489.1 unnamed protein product [Rotaria magnacalcarata]CAF2075126.1 unnamed protein product [Rotaria magnacalcarata]CAF3854328.1 unnamed protein product [Rotaria magnacalcarata]CAF3861060.1 unnamed protein product [Rotaria magnacalcarata]
MILLTITIFTICGICFFIFICAIQSKFLHYFQRKTNRTYHITASEKEHETHNDVNTNNIGLITKPLSNELDRRAYLKVLEKSLRTGRTIQEELDDTLSNTTNDSHIDLMYLVRRYIDEHLSSTTNHISTNMKT